MLRRIGCLFLLALPAGAQEPLNVLWLTVEDMSPWIACYGDATVPTPHLDALASQSIRYTNAFATSPVCAPARSSLITGLWATRIGTMHMRTGNPSKAAMEKDPEAYDGIPSYEGLPPAAARCFPETLRAAGYYCTNRAKTDYQFRAPVTVWDASGGQAHWRGRGPGQPFFAVFNHAGTHESRAFPGAQRRPAVADPATVPVPPLYPDTPAVRDALARTYDNIAAMDAWVGQRLDELEADGLADSTVVFFFSDHGVGLPRGKRSPYDLGTRVPLLVRLPDGRGAGTTDERVVSFVDFGPTVLSLAGLGPAGPVDGRAFLGAHAVEGGAYAFSHADRFDSVYDRARAVTNGRFRYVRNFETDIPYILPNAYRERLPMTADLYALRAVESAPAEQWQMAATVRPDEELYDSRSDPWEVRNLIDSEEHEAVRDELRAALHGWLADTGDLGFVLPETRLVRERIWPPEGEQPTTAPPAARVDGGRVVLSCETVGASIGYRAGEGPWHVYSGPFELSTVGPLELVAHRIGWKPSAVRTYVPR